MFTASDLLFWVGCGCLHAQMVLGADRGMFRVNQPWGINDSVRPGLGSSPPVHDQTESESLFDLKEVAD